MDCLLRMTGIILFEQIYFKLESGEQHRFYRQATHEQSWQRSTLSGHSSEIQSHYSYRTEVLVENRLGVPGAQLWIKKEIGAVPVKLRIDWLFIRRQPAISWTVWKRKVWSAKHVR